MQGHTEEAYTSSRNSNSNNLLRSSGNHAEMVADAQCADRHGVVLQRLVTSPMHTDFGPRCGCAALHPDILGDGEVFRASFAALVLGVEEVLGRAHFLVPVAAERRTATEFARSTRSARALVRVAARRSMAFRHCDGVPVGVCGVAPAPIPGLGTWVFGWAIAPAQAWYGGEAAHNTGQRFGQPDLDVLGRRALVVLTAQGREDPEISAAVKGSFWAR